MHDSTVGEIDIMAESFRSRKMENRLITEDKAQEAKNAINGDTEYCIKELVGESSHIGP